MPGSNVLSLRILFTNPDIADVFPSFVFRAVGGPGSTDNIGTELRGLYTLVDAFKVYASNLYHATGNINCYPTKPLWHTQTNYHCYVSQQSQSSGGYYILKVPLVH